MISADFQSQNLVTTIKTDRKAKYRAFSRDITAAILVFQNKETAAILVSRTSRFGVELYFYAKIAFCLSIPIWRLVT